jgi:hypothetical protein
MPPNRKALFRCTQPNSVFMWMKPVLIFSLALLITSCNEYQESPTSETALKDLNRFVDSARSENASWTSSPDKIARALFPQQSSEGNRKYSISSESTGIASQKVTVLEEGAIDDEVSGERHVIIFKQDAGQWKIVDYRYAAKRRD